MRTNRYTHMSMEERETLSVGLAQGQSLRRMATVLGRAPSTVSREHVRNARGHPYRACTAQRLAAARARQPRRARKLLDPWLWQYVRTHLGHGDSPEQIADVSDARILTTWRNTARPKPSTPPCIDCHAAPCGATCWPRCVRRARRAGLGREEQTDAANSRT